jgi:hypothetical protein
MKPSLTRPVWGGITFSGAYSFLSSAVPAAVSQGCLISAFAVVEPVLFPPALRQLPRPGGEVGVNPGGHPTFGPAGTVLIDAGPGDHNIVNVFGNFPVEVLNG